MKFDNCTQCGNPIVQRVRGGVALVNYYRTTKTVENLCTDCMRENGELAESRLEGAVAEAERSGA